MSLAPPYLVFDGGVNDDGSTSLPRRPTTDDLGGAEKVDDQEFPPDEVEMPEAGGWNQKVKVTARLAVVASACKLEVGFTGGVPHVSAVAALGSAITVATFGTPTDNGTGDTTVSWPADTFPPKTIAPSGLTLFSNGTAPVIGHVQETLNGVRVRTWIWSGGAWVASDIPWTLHLN